MNSIVKIIEQQKNSFGWSFVVEVEDGNDISVHQVSLSEAFWKEITGGEEKPENLVKRSFEFLLERESNQSILKSFNLEIIGKYFPEYKKEISK
jgi:hypothetical protein